MMKRYSSFENKKRYGAGLTQRYNTYGGSGKLAPGGNFLHVKLNSACYNCTVVMKKIYIPLFKNFLCFAQR